MSRTLVPTLYIIEMLYTPPLSNKYLASGINDMEVNNGITATTVDTTPFLVYIETRDAWAGTES